jgi:hypothetical protein
LGEAPRGSFRDAAVRATEHHGELVRTASRLEDNADDPVFLDGDPSNGDCGHRTTSFSLVLASIE